jgi:predicted DNA-binding transcriptional regulator AlpA
LAIDDKTGRARMDTQLEEMLDIKRLSAVTGLAVKTIRNRLSLGEDGDLPPVVRLPSLRWRPADVARWIEDHREEL